MRNGYSHEVNAKAKLENAREWLGHIVWKYDEALEQSLMFLRARIKIKGSQI